MSFEDWIDDDGVEHGKPIRLFVTIEKIGDSFKVDWEGTAQQVKAAINNTLSFTKAASYAAIRCILQADIPTNAGFFAVLMFLRQRALLRIWNYQLLAPLED